MAPIELIQPDESWRDELIAYCQEFKDAGEPVAHGILPQVIEDFPGLLRQWADHAAGRNLPEGKPPYTVFWLVDGRTLLGTARLRHCLTEATTIEGGHIGYEIRPSQRRHGHATLLLRLVLDEARRLGLARVLLTCSKNNVASAGVIEHNHGVLENEIVSHRTGELSLRYWIQL